MIGAGADGVPDWPRPGMGPLGGMAGALRFARDAGFGAVLTCGVDSLGLPDDLPGLLAPGPAYVADQPVVGLWPVAAVGAVEAILAGSGRHSMRALAEAGRQLFGVPGAVAVTAGAARVGKGGAALLGLLQHGICAHQPQPAGGVLAVVGAGVRYRDECSHCKSEGND